MSAIQQLPTEVRSYLRSGVTVTSVTQCVEELLLNSLDAGATCVAVRVDLDCFKIQVIDNGIGIPRDELKLLGERYATSKCHSMIELENLSYFGYRGEALASIRESCSVLEITTKTKNSSKTFCKLFQDGQPLQVIESAIPRPSVGTTVTVHDLFSNFPVRRKATNTSLELERIRQRVEALALLRSSVSISLRNDSTSSVLVQTHKCNNSLLTFKYLFGSAKASALAEVNGSKNYFTVEGYLGKEGHSKKELQFIYVNGRLVLKTAIHKLVNKMLTNSAIFKRKYGSEESATAVENKSVFVKSPGRQIDRYPVFVLNIKCPLTKYDITFDPAKTLIEFKDWDSLLELTKEILNTFLKKENLVYQEETASGESAENKEKGSNKNEGEKNNKESEKKALNNMISPSKLKDTLFSKPVKRKSTDSDPYKTPVSISIEEWNAENKVRKVHVVLNGTETSFSKKCSDTSQTSHTQSNCTNDNSQLTQDSQLNSLRKDKTVEQGDKCSEKQVKQSKININAGCTEKPQEKNIYLEVPNEKGDSNPSKGLLDLQHRQNTTADEKLQAPRKSASDDMAGELTNTIDKACAVPSSSACEAGSSIVSVSSKLSLTEYRKSIGKAATNLKNGGSVDKKLKANFNSQSDGKIEETHGARAKHTDDSHVNKYASSLQKFKKKIVSYDTRMLGSEDQVSHQNKGTCLSKSVQSISHQGSGKESLSRSRISYTDSKANSEWNSDIFNSFQRAEADQNLGSNSCHKHPDFQYDNDSYGSRLYTTDITATKEIMKNNDGDPNLACIFPGFTRKRSYHGNESETIAYKLSKLRKQKTATISVTSCLERYPVDSEIICDGNAMVTSFISEKSVPSICTNFPPPSATATSSSASFDHPLTQLFHTESSQYSQCYSVFLDNENKSESCDKNVNGKELFINNFSSEAMHLNINDKNNILLDLNRAGPLAEDANVTLSDDVAVFQPMKKHSFHCSVPVSTEEADESSVDFGSSSMKHICNSFRCVPKGKTEVDIEKITNRTSGLKQQYSEIIAGTAIPSNGQEDHSQSDKRSNVVTDTYSQPFEFSTQGFSPCLSGSQTGLSQKMTDVSISQASGSAKELTPFMGTSPCSEGFSPCMSVSPVSLPDNYMKDSQGFTTYSEAEKENKLTSEEFKVLVDNSVSAGINFEVASIDNIITDKSNCLSKSNQESISVTYGAEYGEKEGIVKAMSDTEPVENHFEKTEKQKNPKTVSNDESENDSEDTNILLSNETIRISQMLLTTSQHKEPMPSSVDSLQSSPDIHYSDIFSSSMSNRINDCVNTQTDDLPHDGCMHRSGDLEVLHPENGGTRTNNVNTDISRIHLETSVEEIQGDDTLLQPTPDATELFSSWDSSCENDALNQTKEKEENVQYNKSNNSEIDHKSSFNEMSDCVKTNERRFFGSEELCKEVILEKETVPDDIHVEDPHSGLFDTKSAGGSKEANTYVDKELTDELTEEADVETEQRKWIHLKDPQTGKKIYVHSLLGTTVTESHWKVPQADSSEQGSHAASKVSDGSGAASLTPKTAETLHSFMADLLATDSKASGDNNGNDEEDLFVKWRDSHTPVTVTNQGPSLVEELLAAWDNPVFESTDKDVINTEISALPKNTVKAYRALSSCKFTKEMLNTVKVIGQVDKKFIACLMKTDPSRSTRPDMLAVIDQHAAHERIRLELLTEEAYSDSDVDSGKLEVYKVEPQKSLELTDDEIRIMVSYTQEFNRIGVKFHCDPHSRNKIVIETIPACIMEKDVNYVKSMRETVAWNIVKALIKEHVDLLVSTQGAGKKFPTVLHKALCSQACHGAIKFGDSLSLRECKALLRDLSRCDLPFQCAHGRPSVMPVLQLEHLRTKLPQEKQKRPQLYKLSNAIQKDNNS